MKSRTYLSFFIAMVFLVNLCQAQQEPKKASKKKSETTVNKANPGHKKNKNGSTDRIDVSDQGKQSEGPATKKSSNKDKAVLPKK